MISQARLTQQQQLDFFSHALLLLADDLVQLSRASLAIFVLVPSAEAHRGVLGPRIGRRDGLNGVCNVQLLNRRPGRERDFTEAAACGEGFESTGSGRNTGYFVFSFFLTCVRKCVRPRRVSLQWQDCRLAKMLPCCQRSIGREMRCFPGFLSSPLCFAVVSVLREKAPVNLESLSARRCVGSVNRRRPSSIGVRIRARMERRREDGLWRRGLELPSRQGSSTTKQASKPTTTELTLPCRTDSTSTSAEKW